MNKFTLTVLACTALSAGTVMAQQNTTLPAQQTTPPSTSQAVPDNSAATLAPRTDSSSSTDSSANYQTPQATVGTTAQTEQKGSDTSASGTVRSGGSIPSSQYDMNDKSENKPGNPAINTNKGESRTAAAPVPGRNSFTEGEARNRIEKFGYTSVTGLKKDANGIWRGTATKSGTTGDVALDYQGNIVMGK